MRVLLLTTDAYGGHGGIALYNRDIADALAEMPEVSEVVVVPRTLPLVPEGIPGKVRFHGEAAGSKWRYVGTALRCAFAQFDLVICGHVNLLPLAAILRMKLRCPLVLMVYGVDVWTQMNRSTRYWLRKVSAVWSISRITQERMNTWAALPSDRYFLLPNAIHLERYGLRAKSPALLARYGLQGRRVILTVARLPGAERYKGVDEILEVLPSLIGTHPDLCYVIAGDGDDRDRLTRKAYDLGLDQHVVFTGFVAEHEKADHYRLADVFAMPGRGEGFGFVFLEALACGVPTVGSLVDGSREALLDGALGELVDPLDQDSIRTGILRALGKPIAVPERLAHYAWPGFRARLQAALDLVLPVPMAKT